MTTEQHQTYVYVGLAGEGANIGSGGLYRKIDGVGDWENISEGLPPEPNVRALLVHPQKPNLVYAGTQEGVYRSQDHGDHWEALQSPGTDLDTWSLAFHPHNPDIIYAG
ncbi:MAG: WD40/YVTN/BNR-like repeat-containing protein, partial [Dehalococcoidia bacterium]